MADDNITESSKPEESQSVSRTSGAGLDDLDLPRSVIARIAKQNLPDGTLIQKDARNAMTKAATVFISYLSAAAHDIKSNGKSAKKYVSPNAQDVFKALEELDMEDLVDESRKLYDSYRQIQSAKRAQYRVQKRDSIGSAENSEQGADSVYSESLQEENDGTELAAAGTKRKAESELGGTLAAAADNNSSKNSV